MQTASQALQVLLACVARPVLLGLWEGLQGPKELVDSRASQVIQVQLACRAE